jgi:NAD(P)-dependent dehydrogenase (short-subunit alcohol dehydrogenase family)
MKLKGKVAVITGGTKGIGLGIAIEFAREGASVVIGGRDARTGAEGLAELASEGYGFADPAAAPCAFVPCDVAKIDDLDAIIASAVERFGRLDIYVANAGINDPAKTPYLDISPEQYDSIMAVNLRGMFFGGQRAARQMAKQGTGGAIINMSSVNAHLALDSQMVYTTSKGGIQQLTKVQAVALARYGIKVNALAPGPIDTELMRRVGSDTQLMDTILSRTPIGRIGTPRECGRLAVFLASEDSDFIFGQSIYIDGGRGFQAFPTPGYKTVTDADYALLQKMRTQNTATEGST